jgi:hypothetical protein
MSPSFVADTVPRRVFASTQTTVFGIVTSEDASATAQSAGNSQTFIDFHVSEDIFITIGAIHATRSIERTEMKSGDGVTGNKTSAVPCHPLGEIMP